MSALTDEQLIEILKDRDHIMQRIARRWAWRISGTRYDELSEFSQIFWLRRTKTLLDELELELEI